jgi:plasmid replication initiation protein
MQKSDPTLPSLKKHVSAIHVSAPNLTLIDRKSMNAAIYLARESIKNQGVTNIKEYLQNHEGKELDHVVSLTDFKSLINFKSRNHEHLKDSLRRLTTTRIEFDLIKSQNRQGKDVNVIEDEWSVMPIFSKGTLREGTIIFRFPSEIRRLLLNPDIYSTISFSIQNLFSSEHALSLYENTNRFSRIGKTPRITIQLLRKMLDVEGKSYNNFGALNRNIIKKAVSQINAVSNITIEPIFFKEGRNVVSVQFLIQRKSNFSLFDEKTDDIPADVELSLSEFGLSEGQISKIFDKFDLDYIDEKIIWIQSTFSTNQDIENKAAFAYTAIFKNYSSVSQLPFINSPRQDNEAGIVFDDNTRSLVQNYTP